MVYSLSLLILSLTTLTTLPTTNAQSLTWAPVPSPTSTVLSSVFCVGSSSCWAVGGVYSNHVSLRSTIIQGTMAAAMTTTSVVSSTSSSS